MKHQIGTFSFRCLVAVFFMSAANSMFNEPEEAFALPAGSIVTLPLPVLFFILLAGTVCIVRMHRQKMRDGKFREWSVPSWFSNPLDGNPHFMHMGANAFVLMGLLAFIQSAVAGRVQVDSLLAVMMGWSILLGNTLFYTFFYDRMKSEEAKEVK